MFHCIPLNGNHSGDVDGCFTFISEQGNSVIDYCVVSSDFVCKTDMHFEVGSRVETSHMPIQLSIDSKQLQQEQSAKEIKRESMTKIKWDQEKAEEFHEAINSETSKESFQEAFGLLETSVESALKKFNDTVLHAAECMTRTICFKTGAERDTNKWFDRECVTKKRAAR